MSPRDLLADYNRAPTGSRLAWRCSPTVGDSRWNRGACVSPLASRHHGQQTLATFYQAQLRAVSEERDA
jgi:hypothetical protein